MTPLLAVLEFGDYAIIACIVIVFAGGAAFGARSEVNLLHVQRQLDELRQRLDALLKHQGIVLPPPPHSDLSPELQSMARDPSRKIAAIKRYREEHPATGLSEAKERIERFARSGQ